MSDLYIWVREIVKKESERNKINMVPLIIFTIPVFRISFILEQFAVNHNLPLVIILIWFGILSVRMILYNHRDNKKIIEEPFTEVKKNMFDNFDKIGINNEKIIDLLMEEIERKKNDTTLKRMLNSFLISLKFFFATPIGFFCGLYFSRMSQNELGDFGTLIKLGGALFMIALFIGFMIFSIDMIVDTFISRSDETLQKYLMEYKYYILGVYKQ